MLTAAAAVVLIAVVVVVAVVRRRASARPVSDPYVDALRLLVDSRTEDAFRRLQTAVRSGSAPTDAYIRLGKMLRERGEATKALQIHKSLTVKSDLTPEEKTELFLQIAEDYAALGRPEQAVNVLETASRRNGLREARIYSVLAREAHRSGKEEESYKYLKEVKRLGAIGDRELAHFLATAGRKELTTGNGKEARRLLQRALKHDEDCAPALLSMGDLEEVEGHTGKAIDHWKQAALRSPELAVVAIANLERLLFERGTFGEIENVYRQIIAARPGGEYAVLSLAGFYRKQGRVQEAKRLLEDFRANHGDQPRTAMALASLYASERDFSVLDELIGDIWKGARRKRIYKCSACGQETDEMGWHCARCNAFDTYVEARV